MIYSGVYHKQAEAQKALGALKKKLPGGEGDPRLRRRLRRIGRRSRRRSSSRRLGQQAERPQLTVETRAVERRCRSHEHASGKKYEEESQELPDVVETG